MNTPLRSYMWGVGRDLGNYSVGGIDRTAGARTARLARGEKPVGLIQHSVQPNATQSTTGAVFTAAQRLLWAEWSTREHEARSTVMLTVLHGIQAEMEYTWSANDMYRHISSRHKVDTTSRRADLSARISLLRLPLKRAKRCSSTTSPIQASVPNPQAFHGTLKAGKV